MTSAKEFRCFVERDSVAAGDDIDAPHSFRFVLPRATDEAGLACVRHVAADTLYLPSVEGGSTWIAYSDAVAVAVISLAAERSAVSVLPTGLRTNTPYRLDLRFRYYHANDPKRLLAEVVAGSIPELRWGERS